MKDYHKPEIQFEQFTELDVVLASLNKDEPFNEEWLLASTLEEGKL